MQTPYFKGFQVLQVMLPELMVYIRKMDIEKTQKIYNLCVQNSHTFNNTVSIVELSCSPFVGWEQVLLNEVNAFLVLFPSGKSFIIAMVRDQGTGKTEYLAQPHYGYATEDPENFLKDLIQCVNPQPVN